jgi:hypothetical protein
MSDSHFVQTAPLLSRGNTVFTEYWRESSTFYCHTTIIHLWWGQQNKIEGIIFVTALVRKKQHSDLN